MDNMPDILAMRVRRYEKVPIDKVKVVNYRNRDKERFEMKVESIEHVCLPKPIRVNDKFLERTGLYELICGEGRLKAHKYLGHETILAEVDTCTRKEAYLQSLVENIARTKPDSMHFARELKRFHNEGWEYEGIANVARKSEHYIRDLSRLVEQGEERLVRGVEQGVFPMKFATQVVATGDAQIQNVLMDAFDEGIVTTINFAQARKIIAARSRENKKKNANSTYTANQLRQDIAGATTAKTSYVREAKTKENRFMTLLNGINSLWKDQELLAILREEDPTKRPELAGDFDYEF